MAAFDYSRVTASAQRLIARFGQVGAIRQNIASGAAHDPTLTPTDYPTTLAVLEYEDRKIDGTLIKQGDRLVYISTEGLTITPTEADQVGAYGAFSSSVFVGQFFQIVRLKELNPAGTAVYYEAQIRA